MLGHTFDSWCVYIREISHPSQFFRSILTRSFPWQSTANRRRRGSPKRPRGKRTLLSNLRNWISRDIVPSVARLMSELSKLFMPPPSETYWPRFRETGKKFLSPRGGSCFAIEERTRWQFLLFLGRERIKDVSRSDKKSQWNIYQNHWNFN